MHIISVVGNRPNFIKLQPLARKLKSYASITHTIIHTGQHYDFDMSDIFFQELEIKTPDINLEIGSGSHGSMTAKLIESLENKFIELQPDKVIVYGDTNSTLAAALAAAKLNIPIYHVEAGLRCFDMTMPEEINRRVVDHLSYRLFCPTEFSYHQCLSENVMGECIKSGDLMYEILNDTIKLNLLSKSYLQNYGVISKEFVMFTAHRPANVDNIKSLNKIADILKSFSVPVIFPVHPRTKKNIYDIHLDKIPGLILTSPLGYLEMMSLVLHAKAVITDSGGLQKESVFLGTKCITMRENTEWIETLNYGNYLVGLDVDKCRVAMDAPNKITTMEWKVGGSLPSEIIINNLLWS